MDKLNLKFYVERFIDKNPFIKEGLYQGYVNSAGLALVIYPYIKSKLGNNISLNAVKMAIFRISKNIQIPKKIDLFKTKEIFIKKGINIFNTTSENFDGKIIKKVKGKYHSSIRGKTQKTFIFDDFYKKQVEELFFINKKYENEIISDLVIIGVKLDFTIQNCKGVFYLISKELFFYGVNILQVIQTENEFSVVIERKNLKDAVHAISSI